VLVGVFVTAFYSFRMYFLVFHGKERFGHGHGHATHDGHAHAGDGPGADGHHGAGAAASHKGGHDDEHHGAPHESPAVVTAPLALLAIPSVMIGFVAIDKLLFSDFFKGAIAVNDSAHPAMKELAAHFHGPFAMALHGFITAPFFLALGGVLLAWYFYLKRPDIPERIRQALSPLYTLLDNKYFMDRINEIVFAGGARQIGQGLWKGGDVALIDGVAVNGSARLVAWFARLIRTLQSGYIYHYAFAMLLGVALVLLAFLTWPYVMPALGLAGAGR
jgi:NADH-quinone oxidoreductase subunit L